MSDQPARPQTPQAMLHRLPDKPDASSPSTQQPSKYIVLISASTGVAGKVHLASSVAAALDCPLYQGDSLHETAARAARLGSADEQGPNKERYQRMWLSKMTRTGLLFPDESRPATEGFTGFGGGTAGSSSSGSASRRGSDSSIVSVGASSVSSYTSAGVALGPAPKFVNRPVPVAALRADEEMGKTSLALMVTTHPALEQWHKDSIRHVVGEYGIGVIFVPLDEDEELPILRPLDPRTMTSFGSLGSFGDARKSAASRTLNEEIVLRVDVEAKVEDLIEEIVQGVRDIIVV